MRIKQEAKTVYSLFALFQSQNIRIIFSIVYEAQSRFVFCEVGGINYFVYQYYALQIFTSKKQR